MAPGGSAKQADASDVALPCPSISQGWGRGLPSAWLRLVRPFVVVDMLTSSSTGPLDVGQPAASGLGVMIRPMPPCGVTLAPAGSELARIIASPRSVARFR